MTSPWLVTGLVERSRTRTTKEMTTMDWSTIFGLAARHILTSVGGWLALKGMIGADQVALDTFIGSGMTFAGIAWSFYQKYGRVLVDETLAKARGVHPNAIMIAIVAAGLLAVPNSGHAADMQPVPVVRKAVTAAPVQSWSGFYFGINGSGAKMSGKAAIPGDVAAVNPAGAMAGVMAGYGGWLASGAYVGLEAMGDYDFSQANTCLIIDCKIKSGANLSQRLVVGMTLPQIMSKAQARGVSAPSQWPVPLSLPADFSASAAIPYLAVGLAERQTQACAIDCERKWLLGWQVGGGIKAPTSSGVTLDVGYAYTNWMKNRQFDVGVPVDMKATGEHKMTAGVQFHL